MGLSAYIRSTLYLFVYYFVDCTMAQNSLVSPKKFLVGTKFSDLINANVTVVVDPLRVIYETFDGTFGSSPNQSDGGRTRIVDAGKKIDCRLTIHRNVCSSPKIRNMERIAWDTRICFKWKCNANEDVVGGKTMSTNTDRSRPNVVAKNDDSTFAMRVENCWTGSIQNPIFMINKNGCTNEKTMITSPIYDSVLRAAVSYGWLSVRLVGVDHIRLVCAIRLCSVCDQRCALVTPPKCLGSQHHQNATKQQSPTIWQQPDTITALCNPPLRTIHPDASTSSSSSQYLSSISGFYYPSAILLYLSLWLFTHFL